MSALRASPSSTPSFIPTFTPTFTPSSTPTFTPTPSLSEMVLNKTVALVTSALRIHHSNHITEELTMAMGDPTPSQVDNIKTFDVFPIVSFICIGAIGYFILAVVYNKHNINEVINTAKPTTWISNKYNEIVSKDVLPVTRPKKAKESPFISTLPTPLILPTCPRLDGAEKGQNIMFRFRGPQRARIESSEMTNDDNETRITIIAVLGKPPLPPSHI